MFENSKVFIAISRNNNIRHAATSGGLGSGIVRYLFEQDAIGTAVSFKQNPQSLLYEPVLVYCADDYVITGSIYHEINLVKFIRENVDKIRGRFVCFALPCQVKGIKSLLKRNHIENIVIELTCSSQQTFEATKYLFKRLKVDERQVQSIRYRGNGWPSGVCITTVSGKQIFVDNNNSVWMDIFHSKLFCMQRCYQCNMQNIDTPSDLILADPWRIDIPDREKEGRTLCRVKSDVMERILSDMYELERITFEERPEKDMYFSQEGTILKKNAYLRHKIVVNYLKKLFLNKVYRRLVLGFPLIFNLHVFALRVIHKLIIK